MRCIAISDDDVARKIVLKSQEYVLREGLLYHLYTPYTKRLDRAMSSISQVCVPRDLHEIIMKSVHGSIHSGFDRLYMLQLSLDFIGIECIRISDIHDFMTTCFE